LVPCRRPSPQTGRANAPAVRAPIGCRRNSGAAEVYPVGRGVRGCSRNTKATVSKQTLSSDLRAMGVGAPTSSRPGGGRHRGFQKLACDSGDDQLLQQLTHLAADLPHLGRHCSRRLSVPHSPPERLVALVLRLGASYTNISEHAVIEGGQIRAGSPTPPYSTYQRQRRVKCWLSTRMLTRRRSCHPLGAGTPMRRDTKERRCRHWSDP
jgi:hypothetical protein